MAPFDEDLQAEQLNAGLWWEAGLRKLEFVDQGPPSTWEERVLGHVEEHVTIEASAGAAYDDFARVDDPQVKYLAALVAADERRHHAMFSDMATALRRMTSGEPDYSSLSNPAQLSEEDHAKLLEDTRRLLEVEKKDESDLRDLHRDLRSAPEESIWPLMVEIMKFDTAKHIAILEAIERHLTQHRWKSSR